VRTSSRGRWLVAALAAVAAAAWFGFTRIVPRLAPCADVVRYQVPSPTGRYRAVVFDRECGGPLPFATQVSIVPDRAAFSAARHPPILVVKDRVSLAIHWTSDTELAIGPVHARHTLRATTRWQDVAITYRDPQAADAPRGQGAVRGGARPGS
jgi:hypothetical protein